MEANTPEQKPEEMITVFECKMHGSIITDESMSNILGMIETELENLENDEFEVINIRIKRKTMTVFEYKNLPEFEGY